VSGIILARLLTPEDFGLVGLVTVVTSFALLFGDFGLSLATIQKEHLTHVEATALFWFNVGISGLLAVVIGCLGPALAWFYGEGRVVPITAVLAACLLVVGLRNQHCALLKRQLRFGAIATIELSSTVCGILAGIGFAWFYASYWALVFMQVVTTVAACLGYWIASAWRPGWPVGLSTVRAQLLFGTHATGSQIALFLSRNLDNVLIGRYWGAEQLGLYARAYQLMLLPLQQITLPVSSVAIRMLSLVQADPERFRRYYCKALSAIGFVAAPLMVTAAALSDEIILLLLGDKWAETSQLFKVLALVGLTEPINGTTGWVQIATGQTQKLVRWGVFQAVLIVASFVVGLPWGALGVAIAFAICKTLLLVPTFRYTLKDTPVTGRSVIEAVWRPACLCALLFAVLTGVHYSLPEWSNLSRLLAACVAGLVVYGGVLLAWPRARAQADVLLAVVRLLRQRNQLAPAGPMTDGRLSERSLPDPD
jgi:PST family polysaccharide transporter